MRKLASISKSVNILFIVLAALCILFMAQTDVAATENGLGAYQNGAECFMAGAVPPPGTYFLNYFLFYTADKFKIKDGDDLPTFDAKVTADVMRLIYVTKYQILGGFWGIHVFLPFVNVDLRVPDGSDSKFGIGDVIVDPFILSWHSKNWHFATGVDIYIPTGAYDKDDIANVGLNHWTFEPIAAFTFVDDSGFELSSKFMYDFNTENNDTDYKSGQEFHFDYLVGYNFKPWGIGLSGYYYKQITDDRQDGEKVEPDGFKGQVFAIGPSVKYDYKNMTFNLKYQREMAVENKPEGDRFWFKFVYAF
jgi:hypothetical protein